MPERLYFTDSDEANSLIATDPMALLIGFALDQQVTVQKAFSGPLALRERLGSIDAAALASADLEPVFRAKPAIHRFPGAMAKRVHDLAFFGVLAPLAMAFVGLDGAAGFRPRPLHHPELLVPDGAVRAVARVQAVLYLAAAGYD